MITLILLFLLCSTVSECVQDSDCGGSGGTCNVTIGGKKYCSKCGSGTAGARVPVNGDCRLLSLSRNICIVPTDSSANTGSCTGCIRDFLFYRGGCYRTAALINAICKEKHVIEEGMYCGACAIDGDVPIDGVCVAADTGAAGNTCANGVCTTCASGYFFHYGSCYKFGGSPGSSICSDVAGTTGSVCTTCGSKFAKNPETSASTTSCFACYGLDGTLFCNACRLNVLTGKDVKPTLCTQCQTGYVPIDGRCLSNYSFSAALAGCSDSKNNGLCEDCSSGYMLFYGSCYSVNGPIAQAICATENQIYVNGRILCKQCVQPDHYPLNGLCTAGGSSGTTGHTCVGGMCTSCDSTTNTDSAANFFLFYGGCYNISLPIGKTICTTIASGVCTTCATSDLSSVITITATGDSAKCLACWDEAATGVANCGGCSLSADADSKAVCTKCSDSTEPKDNTCPQALPPTTPEGCAVQGCQACSKGSATTCDTCFSPLIMKEDRTKCFGSCLALGLGYYNNSGTCTRCIDNCVFCISGDSCSQCAEGYYLDTSAGTGVTTGTCKLCATGCSTCNGGAANECTTCLSGYYFAVSSKETQTAKCVLCNTTDETGYTGIQHCAACRSTVGNNGSKNVICQKCEDGYLKETDQGATVCTLPAPDCSVDLCALCVEGDATKCEHCVADSYLCPRTATCTKDCATCGASMYADEDLGECQPCNIANCQVCATGLKCDSCTADSVPVSPDVYHTACLGCDDTAGMNGWTGLAGCKTCELTDKGGGSVNCLDPGYYRKGGLGAGGTAAIVIVVLLVLAVAGFLVWWFVFRKRGRSSRRGGASYTSLMRGESPDYRQSLI
ncbi:Variant-specific surface protein [Giardia duodenalis]|uniref:Variant-specific surface protein n=1 Tax=Giardia intestinalis TaxID=5741 RepID=V6TVL8_GIAIN|nr:Variant-specific surface protein [Giardia intestinalis]